MSRRLLATGFVAVVGVLLLAGCGSTAESDSYTDTYQSDEYEVYNPIDVQEISLPDGRTVMCITYQEMSITCDWDNAE